MLLKFLLKTLLLAAVISAQTADKPKFVFDYYINSPALDSEAVIDLMVDATPGITFPLNHEVPKTSFDCAKVDGPGYYTDPEGPSFCQAFYRCDISGNQTGFLCPNSTLFNQITLACDYYFNVDCGNVTSFYNYGNSRLYQGERPLFDTPPKGYVSSLSGFYEDRPKMANPQGPNSARNQVPTTTAAPPLIWGPLIVAKPKVVTVEIITVAPPKVVVADVQTSPPTTKLAETTTAATTVESTTVEEADEEVSTTVVSKELPQNSTEATSGATAVEETTAESNAGTTEADEIEATSVANTTGVVSISSN